MSQTANDYAQFTEFKEWLEAWIEMLLDFDD